LTRPPTPRGRGPIQIPAGATEVEVSGPRPFLTRIRYRTADGALVDWAARRHRRTDPRTRGLTFWIGLLFAVGSVCFLVAPVPAFADWAGSRAVAVTFVVGSLLYTPGAYLGLLQVVRQGGHRWFGWSPHLMGYWAALVQFVGALAFNVSTAGSLLNLDPAQAERIIWRPDMVGSICFLVASAIAFAEAGHRWFSWRPGHRDWHITALNWWGSVFFGISAIGAYILPDGSELDTRWANGGTFLGAACFLVASVLTIQEARSNAQGAAA
jgi:hypothetical protein